MFDARTAELLQSAPSFHNLSSIDLPKILTQQYADLVSIRLRGHGAMSGQEDGTWSLDKIANAYEALAAVHLDQQLRRSAAFVAGTAHQIIAKANKFSDLEASETIYDRDRIASAVAAPLLFLIAEQYADAFEAASYISDPLEHDQNAMLVKNIKSLAAGRFDLIIANELQPNLVVERTLPLQEEAMAALSSTLIEGIELLSSDILSDSSLKDKQYRFSTAQEAFRAVLQLSTANDTDIRFVSRGSSAVMFPGPAHLASLLLAASESLSLAALTKLPAPQFGDQIFWGDWLKFRARTTPLLWPNHREAIGLGFYTRETSAVLVLPTGAGKTTVSSLKIAATLASGKNVVFLAPTHALVEQLTDDLELIFPSDHFGLQVSNDNDIVFIEDTRLKDIEIMTPERCLTMLSFSPESFNNVGLLVFDECHLLSPQEGRNRRALDSMLCLLTFNMTVPNADMLFLSAMLRNGPQFSDWIQELTGRRCLAVDLLWKPSRQVRGVVIYDKNEVALVESNAFIEQRAIDAKKNKVAAEIRTSAERQMNITPYAAWGLTHNWLASGDSSYYLTKVSETNVQLAGKLNYGTIRATPNVNNVAISIAGAAVKSSMKTIIFVNTKLDTIGIAEKISQSSPERVIFNNDELAICEAIEVELGGFRHSVFSDSFAAVPHNSTMLRIERLLSEKLFRRPDASQVIVATPTLAQGLNLPAQLAVIAGDKRVESGIRVSVEAHELLNAAARAGRAGHLANGAVLLIPDPICTFTKGKKLSGEAKNKLSSILPEDDRCVDITDPLDSVLDRIMQGDVVDRDVRYAIHRLALFVSTPHEANDVGNVVRRSLGAYIAQKTGDNQKYENSVLALQAEVKEVSLTGFSSGALRLATQSGLPLDVVTRILVRVAAQVGKLPTNIIGWITWVLEWLADDEDARDELIGDVSGAIATALGYPAKSPLDKQRVLALETSLIAWVKGQPLNSLERILGGDPDSDKVMKRTCVRARALVMVVIPRGLAYAFNVVVRAAEELKTAELQESLPENLLKGLPGAVRRGFDSVHKMEFANKNRGKYLSRVQLHTRYREIFGEGP